MHTQRGSSAKSALYLIDGGAPQDQAVRLRRFREQHPDVEIILRGPWEAIIPEPDGQRVIVRWELADLLNETERRLADLDSASSGNGREGR
jgi:hypothetical protein